MVGARRRAGEFHVGFGRRLPPLTNWRLYLVQELAHGLRKELLGAHILAAKALEQPTKPSLPYRPSRENLFLVLVQVSLRHRTPEIAKGASRSSVTIRNRMSMP